MAPDRDSDDLAEEGRRLRDASRLLRSVSDRLISEIRTIRRLEGQARKLPIGSPEFDRVSEEITEHVRSVYLMSAEQEPLGTEAGPRTSRSRTSRPHTRARPSGRQIHATDRISSPA